MKKLMSIIKYETINIFELMAIKGGAQSGRAIGSGTPECTTSRCTNLYVTGCTSIQCKANSEK